MSKRRTVRPAPAPTTPAVYGGQPGSLVPHNLGPYTGVQHQRQVTFDTPHGPRTFRLLTYQAYNAYGLIGSECNGVAVLDEDQVQVLADELGRESTGYFGASRAQVDLLNALAEGGWDAFRQAINTSGRNRYEV